MASESTIDFERLLAPIREDAPSGDYLRRSDFDRFQAVKDARATAVSAERKIREFALIDEGELAELSERGQAVEAPEPPNWRAVLDQCVEIIADHSKDLWVATWLIEANARCNGFAGLRDGFRLVGELCERYWENIYPPYDEDEGYLDTVSQLASLNGIEGDGTLIAPLEDIPLVPGHPQMSYAAYRQATKGTGGDVSEAEFHSAVRQVEIDALRDQEEDLAGAIEAFEKMSSLLQEKCYVEGEEDYAPPSTQIRKTLETIQQTFSSLTRDLTGSEAAGEEVEQENGPGNSIRQEAGPKVDIAQGQVNSREDAFKMLMKASEFFRKTEPHSPVSYMLQQTVEFGRMDLPQLLQKLINDRDVLKSFSERVGIPIDDEDDE
jgi:type VI secretion system protein ImpA